MNAVKCPVCDGSGRYFGITPSAGDTAGKQCHGCHGQGWVLVPCGIRQTLSETLGPLGIIEFERELRKANFDGAS